MLRDVVNLERERARRLRVPATSVARQGRRESRSVRSIVKKDNRRDASSGIGYARTTSYEVRRKPRIFFTLVFIYGAVDLLRGLLPPS